VSGLPANLGDLLAHEIPGPPWVGVILWLPAIAALLCGACAALGVRSKLPAWITVAALAGSFGLTLALFRGPERAVYPLLDWFGVHWPGATFEAGFALYVDSLSMLWMLFVTGLGTLIALYASEYMEHDLGPGYSRFFAALGVFLFAMIALVLADNLLLLYLGWEGVGFASYWLIGYHYKRPAAVAAAKKAFIVNRIGDVGLALAVYLTWHCFGTVRYEELFAKLIQGSYAAEAGGWPVALIPWLLMLGAFGKSAQIPLFVWLPDAMEGPTPVSALIHAATMVTAGVYLLCRMFPVMQLHEMALPAVAWVGGLTALLSATIGLAQHDIKRVFAYSTVSQLGYMFLAVGVAATAAAAFHVFTHAFFKAVLFLSAGAVMHGFAGQIDLRRVSGLRHLPGWRVTSYTMLYACACLAGVPYLTNGFWSKDEILAAAFTAHGPGFQALGIIGLITAFLTAYYAFRVWFRVCDGPVQYEPGPERHEHDHGAFHPHAPRWAINGVLLLISAGAVGSIFCGDWTGEMIAGSTAAAGAAGHAAAGGPGAGFWADPHAWMPWVASACGLLGIAIAWYFHRANRKAADDLKLALRGNALTAWLPAALENKWYVDEMYHHLVRAPLWLFARVLDLFDRYIVDFGIVDGIARLPRLLGKGFQPLANGALQSYAVSMLGGAALVVILVFVMPQFIELLNGWMGGAG
jgi:NADH-quinone oxidoreductase subunit L